MVERGNHNPDVVGSNPTIIILTEGSIAWFNASVLGTEDQRFKSFSSDTKKNIMIIIIIYVLIICYIILKVLNLKLFKNLRITPSESFKDSLTLETLPFILYQQQIYLFSLFINIFIVGLFSSGILPHFLISTTYCMDRENEIMMDLENEIMMDDDEDLDILNDELIDILKDDFETRLNPNLFNIMTVIGHPNTLITDRTTAKILVNHLLSDYSVLHRNLTEIINDTNFINLHERAQNNFIPIELIDIYQNLSDQLIYINSFQQRCYTSFYNDIFFLEKNKTTELFQTILISKKLPLEIQSNIVDFYPLHNLSLKTYTGAISRFSYLIDNYQNTLKFRMYFLNNINPIDEIIPRTLRFPELFNSINYFRDIPSNNDETPENMCRRYEIDLLKNNYVDLRYFPPYLREDQLNYINRVGLQIRPPNDD